MFNLSKTLAVNMGLVPALAAMYRGVKSTSPGIDHASTVSTVVSTILPIVEGIGEKLLEALVAELLAYMEGGSDNPPVPAPVPAPVTKLSSEPTPSRLIASPFDGVIPSPSPLPPQPGK